MYKPRIQHLIALVAVIGIAAGLNYTSTCSRKNTGPEAKSPATENASVADSRGSGDRSSPDENSSSTGSGGGGKSSQIHSASVSSPSTGGEAQSRTQDSGSGNGLPAAGAMIGGGSGAAKTGSSSDPAGGTNAAGAQTLALGGAANPQDASKQAPAPEEVSGCFTINYVHKKILSHSNDETCSLHKNVIKLEHAKVNAKTVCVRINGTPVRFQTSKKRPNEIMIAAIAGPEARITARYCTGKATCTETCAIPKDEFMDAIGGSEDGMKSAQISDWAADDTTDSKQTAKLNADLKKELTDLEAAEPGTSEGTSIFRDWVGDAAAPACEGTKHATADSRS